MEHKCIRYIPLPVLRSYRCLSFVVVQPLSCVLLFVTQWTAAHQASLSFTISWSLPKFMSIAMVMLSSHLILWCLLFLLPSILPSIRDFSNESAVRIRWPKYWSFSFSISPSKKVDFPWNWLVWSPFCPKDSQESSSASQLKSINSLGPWFHYSPALTTICDCW